MESITFQYPGWYILLCVATGLLLSGLLYYRDTTFREQSRTLNRWLGLLRFIVVTVVAILLLQPLIKSVISQTKKPVIVLAQDVSESVGASMDTAALVDYKNRFEQLANQLSQDYEVASYAFGSAVRETSEFEFSDKESNIAALLQQVYDQYSNQNLGAIVMATDGIYNKGSNPIYSSAKLNAPIYTIGLGDTTPQRDLLIKRVFNNKIVYLGDRFSIQVDIAATNAAGSSTTLRIQKIEGENVRTLKQIPVPVDKNDFFTTEEIVLEARSAGVQRYRIVVSGIEGEVTRANNVKDIFIDVLDARQKILLLANAPHPDLTALKQTLENAKNYEITTAWIEDLKADVRSFDFVVLHNLPSVSNSAASVIKVMDEEKIPRLYIVGLQANYRLINQLQPLVGMQSNGRNINEVQAAVAADFNLFTISQAVRNQLPRFAPLNAPFGDFKALNGQTLLYQRIGKVETTYPLLTLGESNGIRMGVFMAEGLFRWRLFDFLQNKNHEIFNEVIRKTVQYLSLKEDKRKFRVSLAKNIFNENEPILMDAELYNENFELINEPDATVVIKNSEGREFPFTFNKTEKTYNLRAGIFPVGNYTFTASVVSAGGQLTYSGQFSVQPIQLERYATTADHGMLRLLSREYGGQFLLPGAMASIPELLAETSTVKPVVYSTTKTQAVIHLKWIFFVLLVFLTLEWFLRRYFGGY